MVLQSGRALCDELAILPLRVWQWFLAGSKGHLDPVDVVSDDCLLPMQVRASGVLILSAPQK